MSNYSSSEYSSYHSHNDAAQGYREEGSARSGAPSYPTRNQRICTGQRPRSRPRRPPNNQSSASAAVDRRAAAPSRPDADENSGERYNFRRKGLIPTGLALLTLMLAMISLLAGLTPTDSLNACNLLMLNTSSLPGYNDFYSIHAMAICTGSYETNAAGPIAKSSPTECQSGLGGASWDLIGLMTAGGDLDKVVHRMGIIGIDYQTVALLETFEADVKAVAFLLLLGMILAGISTLASAATIFAPPDKHAREPDKRSKGLVKVNFAITACAFFFLFLAACIGTGASQGAAERINLDGTGQDGMMMIRAEPGKKWPGLAWSATCVVALQLIYYVDQMMIVYDRVLCGKGRNYFGQPLPATQTRSVPGVSQRGD